MSWHPHQQTRRNPPPPHHPATKTCFIVVIWTAGTHFDIWNLKILNSISFFWELGCIVYQLILEAEISLITER